MSLTPKLYTRYFASLLAIAATTVSLAACSGGGGSGGGPVTPATVAPTLAPATPTPKPSSKPTPTPTASPTPVPTLATVTGTVVDFDSNKGLSGINVALVQGFQGARYDVVAVTRANGSFSFQTRPGNYALAIGSNSPTDTTRATQYQIVELKTGANPLTAPAPLAAPQVTLLPSQVAGNFRLALLNAVEQSCITAMNTGRTKAHLPNMIYDEDALEASRGELAEEIAQNTDTPSPLFDNLFQYYPFPGGGGTEFAGEGFSSCTDYALTYSFSPSSVPYSAATDPTLILYAGNWGTGTGNNYTNQTFNSDPRSDVPH
jgi:hypothetical protein